MNTIIFFFPTRNFFSWPCTSFCNPWVAWVIESPYARTTPLGRPSEEAVGDRGRSRMNCQIRQAVEADTQAISDVAVAAFGDVQGQERADLVTGLLKDSSARPSLSLVAISSDQVIGHILFTGVRVKHSRRMVFSSLLAPLSVHPDYQSQTIGGQLIKEGLQQLTILGVELVFVPGHPGCYPQYGFSAAGIKGFEAPYPIPPENAGAWMVQELQRGVVGHVRGQVICPDALNDPKHWRE